LDGTAIKSIPIGPDRSYISNIDSIKTTTIYSTPLQPVGQYVMYKQSPTIAYTSGIPAPTYSIAPTTNFSYATPATHYPYIYSQQPPQPLASTASKPADITASSTAQKEPGSNVQEMLKEFKTELSAQKSEKSS
jgi:hypothetical protein